jgi:hypothetical protein
MFYLKAKKVESAPYIHAPLLVFIFLGCLVKEKNKYSIKILLAAMKTLANSKDLSGNRIIISIFVIGRFSPVFTLIA